MMLRASLVLPVFGSLALALLGPVAAAEDLHEVTAAPATAKAGAPAKASITLAAKNGWHLNEEAPISVKLTPATGVTVDKPKLARKDIAAKTQDEARFDVGFTATEPGPKTIEAEARYVICQETACKQVTGTATVKLDVESATPEPAKTKAKSKAKAKTKKS